MRMAHYAKDMRKSPFYSVQGRLFSRAMTVILGFDTATSACSAALSVDGEIYEQWQLAPQKHANLLLGMIQHLTEAAGITLRDIEAIAFGQGPGSFMGLRIAAGVAQGLAFALEKPVLPVPTLQVLAQTAYTQTQAERVLVAWDARMGEVYWGGYVVKNGLMQSDIPDQLSAPEQIALPGRKTWLAAGNAFDAYAHTLLPLQKRLSAVYSSLYPRAHALVRLALAAQAAGAGVPAHKALPVYLRDKVAEKPKLR